MGFLDGIDMNKINIADLYESQASFLIKKEMKANDVKKDLYKSKNMASFSHYVSGNLYYNIIVFEELYQFPIATIEEIIESVSMDMGDYNTTRSIKTGIKLSEDLGTTTFEAKMKGSELNRWISKAIDKGEFIKIA